MKKYKLQKIIQLVVLLLIGYQSLFLIGCEKRTKSNIDDRIMASKINQIEGAISMVPGQRIQDIELKFKMAPVCIYAPCGDVCYIQFDDGIRLEAIHKDGGIIESYLSRNKTCLGYDDSFKSDGTQMDYLLHLTRISKKYNLQKTANQVALNDTSTYYFGDSVAIHSYCGIWGADSIRLKRDSIEMWKRTDKQNYRIARISNDRIILFDKEMQIAEISYNSISDNLKITSKTRNNELVNNGEYWKQVVYKMDKCEED